MYLHNVSKRTEPINHLVYHPVAMSFVCVAYRIGLEMRLSLSRDRVASCNVQKLALAAVPESRNDPSLYLFYGRPLMGWRS